MKSGKFVIRNPKAPSSFREWKTVLTGAEAFCCSPKMLPYRGVRRLHMFYQRARRTNRCSKHCWVPTKEGNPAPPRSPYTPCSDRPDCWTNPCRVQRTTPPLSNRTTYLDVNSSLWTTTSHVIYSHHYWGKLPRPCSDCLELWAPPNPVARVQQQVVSTANTTPFAVFYPHCRPFFHVAFDKRFRILCC